MDCRVASLLAETDAWTAASLAFLAVTGLAASGSRFVASAVKQSALAFCLEWNWFATWLGSRHGRTDGAMAYADWLLVCGYVPTYMYVRWWKVVLIVRRNGEFSLLANGVVVVVDDGCIRWEYGKRNEFY